MPKVGTKKFSYSKKGKAAAKASISGLRSAKTGLAAVKQDRAEKSLQSGEFRA